MTDRKLLYSKLKINIFFQLLNANVRKYIIGIKMENRSGSNKVILFISIIFIVVALWLGSWYFIDNFILTASSADSDSAARGQFGDKFGAINSLFAGLAFAGIIFTILLQRGDLIETRKAISRERFETTFFELLNLHMNITERVATRGAVGKDAFVSFHEVLKAKDSDFHVFCALSKINRDNIRVMIDSKFVSIEKYPELTTADVNNIQEALKIGVRSLENYLDKTLDLHEKKITNAYRSAAEENIDDFAHYFRNLYNILRFVNESDQVAENEKIRYTKFLRAQLSEAELIVIFYNSICEIKLPGRESLDLGFPKMAKLLVKYNILDNMSPRSIIHSSHSEIFNKNTPAKKI